MKDLMRLLGLFWPYRYWLLAGVALALLTLAANIALMAMSGWFIASMALAGIAGISMNYFTPAAVIRGAAIVRTAGRYAERLVTHEATFRMVASLRVWFFRQLEPLAPSALGDLHSGDLLSRIRADIDSLDQFYLRVLVPVLVALIAVVLIGLVAARYDATISVALVMLLLIAGIALPWLMARLGQAPGKEIVNQAAQMRTQLVENVQGMAELTSYQALEQYRDKVRDSGEAWGRAQSKMGRVAALAQSGLMLLSSLGLLLVLLLAIPLLERGGIEPAQLVMLALFTLATFEAVMPLPEAFRVLGQVRTAAQRIFEIADREPLVTEPAFPASIPSHFDIHIDFDSVSFGYDPEKPVLHNISFSLPQGRRLGIVGPSGAGKSSLIQLLLHYRDPLVGKVALGGRDIASFQQEQLQQWIAVVPQKVFLFNASIRNNLLLAKPDASEAELDRVCRIAQINDFIAAQPDGYDTWVGETGVRVSGGQARRIAIARALLLDFQCLVLDEPGEGLDPQTERDLLASLETALDGRSLILITHSLVGLNRVDQIIVLDQGRCVESGSYASLIRQQGYLTQFSLI
jgi:ATP-binding cassette subfamily C protein CydC